MPPFTFTLKKPNDVAARYVFVFKERPSWEVLSSKIAEQFSTSLDNSVTFTKADGVRITVENEQGLQSFYGNNLFSGKFKGIVQDLHKPDCESATL